MSRNNGSGRSQRAIWHIVKKVETKTKTLNRIIKRLCAFFLANSTFLRFNYISLISETTPKQQKRERERLGRTIKKVWECYCKGDWVEKGRQRETTTTYKDVGHAGGRSPYLSTENRNFLQEHESLRSEGQVQGSFGSPSPLLPSPPLCHWDWPQSLPFSSPSDFCSKYATI